MNNNIKLNSAKRAQLRKLIEQDTDSVIDLILDLQSQVIKLCEKVAELEGRLNMSSRNSSKPPSSDNDNHKPNPKSLRKKSIRKTGGQKGHPGKSLEFSDHYDFKTEHELLICPHTGERLTQDHVVNIIKRQVFDLPQPRLTIHEHWIYQYKNSRGQIVTARIPEGVNAHVQYGKGFYSWLVYLNDYQLIPLNRTREICKDLYGYSVSEDTILKAREHCYDNLEEFESEVKKAIKKSPIAHADETGFKINTTSHWLHTVCNKRYTYLAVHAKRGYEAIKSMGILEEYYGRLVHDCLNSYFLLENCKHSLCNPHLLRELVYSEEELKQGWAKKMKTLLEEAYIYTKTTKESELEKSRARWNKWYEKIILEGYKENPDIEQPPDKKRKRGRKKKTKSRNLLERMDKHREKILAFIWEPQIPFSNNQAEQAIRMLKVKQKISGGFRTVKNAEIFARIRAYISTAQKKGIGAWSALNKTFDTSASPCSVFD